MDMQTTCPACGQPASGRFCSSCGSSLDDRPACTECGNLLPPGGHYCNQCGAPTAATRAAAAAAPAPASTSYAVPLGIGVLVLVAVGVFLFNRGDSDGGAAANQAPVAAAATPPDISNLSPREAADRLFTRVMTAAEGGDSATARQFLPMAVSAYQMVPELDADGHYHLGTLNLLAGDAQAAKAEAEIILASQPDHLFGLFVAARAEEMLGNTTGSAERFERFLEVYDSETAKRLTEYEAHQPALLSMRQQATQAVGMP